MMSDVELPLPALRLQIASGLNVIVQVSRLTDGSRKVTHITEVASFDATSGRYELNDLFVRSYQGQDTAGRIRSELVATGHVPSFVPQLEEHGKALPRAVYDAARAKEKA